MIFFNLKRSIAEFVDMFKILDYKIKAKNLKVILGYHRILPESIAKNSFIQDVMWTSPESFRKQILWMKKIGSIVSIEEMMNSKSTFSHPTFAITFDDGWKDNYNYAYPILKEFNIPAKIFLSTKAIESGEMFWPDEIFYKTGQAKKNRNKMNIYPFVKEALPDIKNLHSYISLESKLFHFVENLKEINQTDRKVILNNYYEYLETNSDPVLGHFCSWDEIKNMSRDQISFGSHTHNHLILKGAGKKSIIYELSRSKKLIESNLNITCEWFCYPNARFNSDDHLLLKEAGYKFGVTLITRALNANDSDFYIPRFLVYEDLIKYMAYFKFRLLKVPYF